MVRPEEDGSSGPFIAGEENQLTAAEFRSSSDDPFDPSNLLALSTPSPDTLQRLDATNSSGKRSIVPDAPLGFSRSADDDSYHEYSDDSAGSSKMSLEPPRKRGSQNSNDNPSPDDVSMDAAWDAINCDGVESDPLFGLFRTGETQHDGFLDESEHLFGSDQPSNFDHSTITQPSYRRDARFQRLQSPQMTTIGNMPESHYPQDPPSSLGPSNSSWAPTLPDFSGMPNNILNGQETLATVFSPQGPSPPGQSAFITNRQTVHPDNLSATRQPLEAAPVAQYRQPGNGYRPQTHFAPPPPRQGSTDWPYELTVHDLPAKSRVETQFSMKLVLSPPPPGVKKLHLPTHVLSKSKLQLKPPPNRSPDMLELSASLVCTSAIMTPELRQRALDRARNNPLGPLPPDNDPENSAQKGGEVRICDNCMARERKRASRKVVKNQQDEDLWLKDLSHRVIIFNMGEIQDWSEYGEKGVHPSAVKVDLSVRLACYCRHHGEKMGFNIIFTLRDHNLVPVAQAMSPAVMITDDHKTNGTTAMATHTGSPVELNNHTPPQQPPPPSQSAGPSQLPLRQGPGPTAGASSRGTTPARASPARSASPSLGGSAKRRKTSSGSPGVPPSLAMTKMETSVSPPSFSPAQQWTNPPYNPNPNFAFVQPTPNGQFVPNPTTPGHGANEASPFFTSNSSTNMGNLAMCSAPSSSHPSRAPSPGSMMNGGHTASQNNISQSIATGALAMPMAGNMAVGGPAISKIIPNEGPVVGGVEVTLLGRHFWNGMSVYFGQNRAQTTTFWSDVCVVCLLPPSPTTGTVPVTCDRPSNFQKVDYPPVLFTYIDDSEKQILRLALKCMYTMRDKDADAAHLAKQVLESHLNSLGNVQSGTQSGGQSRGQSAGAPMDLFADESLETCLLKCLEFIDVDDGPYEADLNIRNAAGHTMLHLACSLGYRKFAAGLLARGADPNALDNGHCTPLHLAAVHNKPEIARRLMLFGADPTVRSRSNLTPLDVSESGEVTRAIRFSEPRGRSQSGGFAHSRASSVSSVASPWEPLSRVTSTQRGPAHVPDDAESLEYTTGDFEDEDPDENAYPHTAMRRPSALTEDQGRGDSQAPLDPISSHTAAIKEQLNQVHQTLALQLQNLQNLQMPQMPQMPTLPGMPFADYHNYLQQAPFMRRMTQYMPGMPGSRPQSPDRRDTSKMDNRWWDLMSFIGNSSTPPPSYEDIFPQGHRDAKQASALRAAAEADADLKCATVYDQEEESTLTEPESKTEVPNVLKIGRKNAITREQQEQFLRAREEKLKRGANDRNLFVIWIPLLVLMFCVTLYNYFPSLPVMIWHLASAMMRSAVRTAADVFWRAENRPAGHVVEL